VAAFAARLKDTVDLSSVRDDLATVVQRTLEPVHLATSTTEAARNPTQAQIQHRS